MPEVTFYKLNPGGNSTILAQDQDFTAEKKSLAARVLMHELHLQAEQVGFIHLPAKPQVYAIQPKTRTGLAPDSLQKLPSLTMMGGEFCLNATRCLAYLTALRHLEPQGQDLADCPQKDLFFFLRTSGLAHPILAKVNRPGSDGDYLWPAQTILPRDQALNCALLTPITEHSLSTLEAGAILVRLPGICHILLDATRFNPESVPKSPQEQAWEWICKYGLQDEEACGVIWHYAQTDGRAAATPAVSKRIIPVVYVRATHSLVPESSCGSGSLALALAMRANAEIGREKPERVLLEQPSGFRLEVCFTPPDATCNANHLINKEVEQNAAWVNGPVILVAKGCAYV